MVGHPLSGYDGRPDAGIAVGWKNGMSDVRTHGNQYDLVTGLQRWTPHTCGQETVTKRWDGTFGCVRCGADRVKEAA